RTWLATSYAVLGTVVGVLGALVLVLVLASLALSFTVVGALVILGGTLVVARRLGRAERTRAEVLLGLSIPNPHLPTEGKWWQRVVARATGAGRPGHPGRRAAGPPGAALRRRRGGAAPHRARPPRRRPAAAGGPGHEPRDGQGEVRPGSRRRPGPHGGSPPGRQAGHGRAAQPGPGH